MLVGFEVDSPSLGLGGLALGIIGVAGWTGRPALPVALLVVWLVPVPIFVLESLSPDLESLWMQLLAPVAEGLGAEFERVGPVAYGPDETRVEFFPEDDGLVLAHALALVGFAQGLRRADAPLRLLGRTAAFGALGFALQSTVMLTALLRAGASNRAGALAALDDGPLIVAALAAALVAVLDARHDGALTEAAAARAA